MLPRVFFGNSEGGLKTDLCGNHDKVYLVLYGIGTVFFVNPTGEGRPVGDRVEGLILASSAFYLF